MDLSSVMLNNLGVLLAHSDMILNNPDFSGLWLKPLKSGMMVGGDSKVFSWCITEKLDQLG